MDIAVELAANQKLQAKLTGCQQEVEVLRSKFELSTAILNTVDAIALALPKGHVGCCNSSFELDTWLHTQ